MEEKIIPNLNSLTTQEVYKYLVKLYKEKYSAPGFEEDDEVNYEEIYDSLDYSFENLVKDVPEASQGGEGEGETYVRVYQIGDRFFKIEGWYQSYNGVSWEKDSFKEVFPVKVLVTKYLEAKE